MGVKRTLTALGLVTALAGCTAHTQTIATDFNAVTRPVPVTGTGQTQPVQPVLVTQGGDRIITDPQRIQELTEQAQREAGIPEGARRVAYSGQSPVGSIIINTQTRQLYFIDSRTSAINYPIAVGRYEGMEIPNNSYAITRRAEWPEWRPTDRMRREYPELPAVVSGGAHNPMGAAALYLGSTLYRIHGTNEPETIGQAVSSGCIRMHNNHIVNLYDRVAVGAMVYIIKNQNFTPGIDGYNAGTPRPRT